MKRILVLILALTLLLSGCSWMDGEYHSVKPHAAEGNKLFGDVVTVTDYDGLRDALVEMVCSGKQQSNIYIAGFALEEAEEYMNTAIEYVQKENPVGAYAVEQITYERGTSGALPAVSVEVTYLHGRQEILRIKSAPTMESVKNMIAVTLRNCESSTVIRANEYSALDVELFVQEYVNTHPHLCMELPQVTVTTYPKRGSDRILEIFFTYQNSRTDLRAMQNVVTPIFAAAELYVQSSDSDAQKYDQLCAFLMERFDYKYETSLTPVYSLLRYGVGDSKAFAMTYSIMCQNADLSCQVVSGTKDGEAYYWNLIRIDGVDYHVDLLDSSETGEFTVMRAEEMDGYVWDYYGY